MVVVVTQNLKPRPTFRGQSFSSSPEPACPVGSFREAASQGSNCEFTSYHRFDQLFSPAAIGLWIFSATLPLVCPAPVSTLPRWACKCLACRRATIGGPKRTSSRFWPPGSRNRGRSIRSSRPSTSPTANGRPRPLTRRRDGCRPTFATGTRVWSTQWQVRTSSLAPAPDVTS
jgi:hypothetical protein